MANRTPVLSLRADTEAGIMSRQKGDSQSGIDARNMNVKIFSEEGIFEELARTIGTTQPKALSQLFEELARAKNRP